ncbi:MAG: DHHA1 domain-containing protein, partial [candidate division Zixibacteria bacterium]|nr:DHHA1 domain-containing protein [candidate division Zixibacteria bacterium]
RNHTATHLAHAALRKVLGQHIKQSGSYVGPDRLRFDFSHHQPMTPEEIRKVEKIVNGEILKGTDVSTQEMDVDSARKTGATALFGEKYGDRVRVVSVGNFSKELCGGTHVDNVSMIGSFLITQETGIASGVRRLEAVTGREAVVYMLETKDFRQCVSSLVGRPESEALGGVEQLDETCRKLQKENRKLKSEMFSGGQESVGEQRTKGAIIFYSHYFGETDRGIMSGWVDMHKGIAEPRVSVALGIVDGKHTYMATASGKAVKNYNIDIGRMTKELLPKFGGRGGGKPSFARGSVDKDVDSRKLFDAAFELIHEEK